MDKPIGRHVGFGIDPNTKTDMEIIGVVKDIKYTDLRDEIPVQMFTPYLASRFVNEMTMYVRIGEPAAGPDLRRGARQGAGSRRQPAALQHAHAGRSRSQLR